MVDIPDDTRGVSPVIGVILMVAITVILAAVVATFMIPMGESIDQDVQAAVTVDFDADGDTVAVTYVSAQDANVAVDVTVTNVSNGSVAHNTQLTSIGESATFDGDSGMEYRVTVVGVDGDRETVIQTKTGEL